MLTANHSAWVFQPPSSAPMAYVIQLAFYSGKILVSLGGWVAIKTISFLGDQCDERTKFKFQLTIASGGKSGYWSSDTVPNPGKFSIVYAVIKLYRTNQAAAAVVANSCLLFIYVCPYSL